MIKSCLSLYELIFAGDCRTISISGESTSGKTTLTLQILKYFLSSISNSGCVWFNSTEFFPTKRFKQFCGEVDAEKFLERVLTIPKNTTIHSIDDLKSCIKHFMENLSIFPYDTTLLVIDNISSQIRHELGNVESVKEKHRIMNSFFLEYFSPLLFATERCNLWLILCHEVSYSPMESKNRAFYDSLYQRMNSVKINLEKGHSHSSYIAKIRLNDVNYIIPYKIANSGLIPPN